MARTRKISSHPILDPEISGRTGEATPRGTVQSLPTSSKESHNDAKHVISLANNMDAHTMIARTARKRQRVLSDKDNSTSKRLRKSHRRHKPSPLEAAASSTIPIGANILSIPLELHQQILPYTSAKDAARLRGVCKGLKAVETIHQHGQTVSERSLGHSMGAHGRAWWRLTAMYTGP